ncbi:MAG: transglutaminase domain-containing protein [Anaerolineaceae bacterium]|nr:transglutaminase domain-containing protein [Anaerolineaceae bacterium]
MVELQLRTIERRLERSLILDSRPVIDNRPIDKKLLGKCRDHSLLLVSMLRHLGVPARARCGFGAYFMPNHFEDHWVVEYWNQTQNQWVLVDAQLDELQCGILKINFDPLDVPRDQFIVGGKAWRMCRSGEQDPNKFGIFDMNGLGFVRGNLVRDIASLNKFEMLPWDCWGIILNEQLDRSEDLILLDEIADLTENDVPAFAQVQELYRQDSRLRLDSPCLSYVNGKLVPVNLAFL